jgi:hypothetical protein
LATRAGSGIVQSGKENPSVPKIPTLALAALLLVTTEANATRPTKGRPIETGQTTSYGPGSDGDIQKGLSPMFSDLGNGVIKDQRTGLFWEKKSDDGSIHDKDNSYTWCSSGGEYICNTDGSPMDGTMVTTFLAGLNTPPCSGGFCDWRIPNVRELATLVNYEAVNPATFGAFNAGCSVGCTVTTCSCTISDFYWSSSTFQDFPVYAWAVRFHNGVTRDVFKADGGYVRAVRGGS